MNTLIILIGSSSSGKTYIGKKIKSKTRNTHHYNIDKEFNSRGFNGHIEQDHYREVFGPDINRLLNSCNVVVCGTFPNIFLLNNLLEPVEATHERGIVFIQIDVEQIDLTNRVDMGYVFERIYNGLRDS